jgi:hypothetical protein
MTPGASKAAPKLRLLAAWSFGHVLLRLVWTFLQCGISESRLLKNTASENVMTIIVLIVLLSVSVISEPSH